RSRSRVVVRPIALLQDSSGRRIDNLFFDEGPRLSVADALAEKLREFIKALPGDGRAVAGPGRESATGLRLRSLEDEILRVSERGLSGMPQDAARIDQLEERLREGGLDLLTSPANRGAELPARVLRLKHCLMVVRELQGDT